MRTRDQYPLTARLHQTQPAREERILETVSNRTEAFFFAYQASRVQGLKRFVYGGGGEEWGIPVISWNCFMRPGAHVDRSRRRHLRKCNAAESLHHRRIGVG